jgi:hypothetical protein
MLEMQLRLLSARPRRGQSHVDAETVGNGEAGALADDHDDHARPHRFTDIVAQRNASLSRDHHRGQRQVTQLLHEGSYQRSASPCTPVADRPSPTTIATSQLRCDGSSSSLRRDAPCPQPRACGQDRGGAGKWHDRSPRFRQAASRGAPVPPPGLRHRTGHEPRPVPGRGPAETAGHP